MNFFGKCVVKARYIILIVSFALLIPSAVGYLNTRINYDMLIYLPKTIETMRGQDILEDEFGTGAIAMVIVEGKENKEVAALKEKISGVPHVNNVLWYDSFADLSVPMELLPDRLLDAFMKGDATLMAVTFDTTTSDDDTMEAVTQIRGLLDEHCFLQGISAVLVDTKNLAEREEPIYVGIAVLLAMLVTAVSMDTFLAPVMFMLSIGMAIIYNLGTNIFMGQISYVTKSLAAVLQLGVTMDYSIFLWHSFKENEAAGSGDAKEAMAKAIDQTLQSVIGSSVTTIAGFAALCFMSFTFGLDVGIVMMKGVAFGVISCVTILPALILVSEKAIDRTRHRPVIPKLAFLPGFVAKHYRLILGIFVLIWIPAAYGNLHYGVYYNLDQTLPRDLPSIVASKKLEETFDMNATMMILTDRHVDQKTTSEMCAELKKVDGVKAVIGVDAFLGGMIPEEMIPEELSEKLSSDNWKLILLTSRYQPGGDEVNSQIDRLTPIIKKYDPKGMLIGDAPCLKDLVRVADHDLNIVNWVSIGVIFVIIMIVFRSLSLPFLLVIVIECAIFCNMAIPYYQGTPLPFIASIVIGTIQLGSTVDYAILMTSRYQTERSSGKTKEEAVRAAHTASISSIICSGLTFFAATFGVGVYSNISLIAVLCILMARGALISTAMVITVLPAVLLVFDPVIVRTSMGFLPKEEKSGSGRHRRHFGKTEKAFGR